MSRRRLEFEPGEASIEAAKLKKFSDGDGPQIEWLPGPDRFSLLGQVQYIQFFGDQVKEPSFEALRLIHFLFSIGLC